MSTTQNGSNFKQGSSIQGQQLLAPNMFPHQRPAMQSGFNMMSQPSIQDEYINMMPTAKLTNQLMSDFKSDLKQGSSTNDARGNKEGYFLSALNSEIKP